jgi:hypothetical protein
MTDKTPLHSLIIDADEVDHQRIADTLKQFVAIDKTGRIVPLVKFQTLSSANKIFAFLLGRKAAVLVGLSEQEAVGPTEIASSTGMAEGTVKPVVRRMLTSRYVSQDKAALYYISPHQVSLAINALSEPSEVEGQSTVVTKTPTKRLAKRTPKRSEARATGTPAKAKAATKPTPAKRKANDFSLMGELRTLVNKGYFDQPKTMGDFQKWVKTKKGRDIPVTSMSSAFTRLLREGALDRSVNAKGIYEYVREMGS